MVYSSLSIVIRTVVSNHSMKSPNSFPVQAGNKADSCMYNPVALLQKY